MSSAEANKEYSIQIIITSGMEAPEKAVLGLAMALSNAVIDLPVVVFFTMKGAMWADRSHGNEVAVNKFDTIAHYLDMLNDYGVRLEACTTCVENCCPATLHPDTQHPMRDGFVLAGLSTAALRATQIPTVVF